MKQKLKSATNMSPLVAGPVILCTGFVAGFCWVLPNGYWKLIAVVPTAL